jgi:site-specific recombinase XerD
MIRDYQQACLLTMPRHELEEFAQRIIGRIISQDAMKELFTFEAEDSQNEDRLRSAQFDALLRMHALALSDLSNLFEKSDNKEQNIQRMSRLLLWHFYACGFHLEETISLEDHCQYVEEHFIKHSPANTFAWVHALNEMLHHYAKLAVPETDITENNV